VFWPAFVSPFHVLVQSKIQACFMVIQKQIKLKMDAIVFLPINDVIATLQGHLSIRDDNPF